MADELKHSDFVSPDALPKFKRDAKKVKEEIIDLEKHIISLLATSSKLAKALSTPKNIKEIKAQNEAIKNIDKSTDALISTRKEMKALDKQIEKDRLAEIKLQKAREKAFDDFAKKEQRRAKVSETQSKKRISNAEKERLSQLKLASDREKAFDKADKSASKSAKAALKVKKANLDSANAFKVLEKNVNTARDRYKRLLAQYGAGAKITLQAQKRFEVLDNRIRKINKSARDGRRDVGRYHLALGKIKGALSSGLGALGIAAGATAIFAAIGNVIGIFKDFEKAGSNLEAILGATDSEMNLLKNSAKELGATTAFTATQVIQLQTEFAKLGFSVKEIDNATASTLALASASGTELAEAAAVVGATLGGFGKDAKETARFTDVMAKSFSSSALDMEKFKESMKSAAPAARAVGLTVEKTTALLGTMANAGISGSKAGNNLKTSLINLNKAGLTLDEGLKKVAKSENKLATATELVGKNAAASFLVLAEGVEITDRLELSLLNAEGAAQRMADIQLDNLAGDITILGSAWEGFVLSVEDGTGALSSFLRGAIQAITGILGFITSIEDATEVSFKSAKANRDLANSSQALLDEYESLVEDGIEPTIEEKEKLEFITLQLKNRLGESVIAINKETGAFELNTDAVREQIKIKRFSSDQEAATLASRLIGIQEEIKILKDKEKEESRIFDIAQSTAKKLEKIRRKKDDDERDAGTLGFLAKKTRDENEALRLLNKTRTKLSEISDKLEDQREKEIDLLEKLNELNFTAADVAALFNVEEEKSIELSEQEEIIVRDLVKLKQAEIKARQEIDATTKAALVTKNQDLKLLGDELRILRELGIEKEKEKEEKRELKPLEQKSGIDPAVLNAIEQEKLARALFEVERARQDSERIFKNREIAASEIEDATERDVALFAIAQERLNSQLGFALIESNIKRYALEADFKFRTEIQEANALKEILLTIETERKKAAIKAESIEEESRINEQARIDSEAATIESLNKVGLETEKHKNELLALDLELSRSQQALLDQKVDNEAAANAKILADTKAANEKRFRENVKLFNRITNNTKSELRKINDLKNKEANEEIRLAEESVRKQEEIAAAGGVATIGKEKARLVKLRLERKRELEAQARQERNIALAQNFVNSLAAHSKDDPVTAFAKASFETLAGGAFAKLLAGFAEGGYTGDGGKYDVAGVVHAGENVNTAVQVRKYNMKNWSAQDFDKKVSEGHFNQYADSDLTPSQYKQLEVGNMMQPSGVDLTPMLTVIGKQTDRLERAFEKGQVKYEVHWNEHGEATETAKRGGVGHKLLFKKSQL